MAQELSPKRTRVLLLTQWFEPEPTFKGLTFARALQTQGLAVEVATGFPNYPGGKLYPGYRVRAWQREMHDGVRVTRLPLYPSHDGSALRRIANYLSFGAAAFLYILFRRRQADVIYAYHPPLTVALAAVTAGWIRRVPVVVDIQDMWPDTLRATGMLQNVRVLATVGRVCGFVYRRAAQITVLSSGFKRLLVERQVPPHKVEVIPNWCDEDALARPQGVLPPGFPGPERFKVLFAGNMGRAQALDTVVNAAEILASSAPRVCFVMLGGGIEVQRLKQAVTTRGLTNVVFLPAVPMNEVGHALKAADALLVHLKRDPLFSITIPSKTQAYMAAGRPVLMGVDGDAARLVQEAACGVSLESEDPRALAQAVAELEALPPAELAAMGQRGQTFYQQHLSLQAGASRFASLFRALAGHTEVRPATAKAP